MENQKRVVLEDIVVDVIIVYGFKTPYNIACIIIKIDGIIFHKKGCVDANCYNLIGWGVGSFVGGVCAAY